MRGLFVTFEGPEGAGKSTVIAALATRLSQRGIEPVVTREPGAGMVGAKIRAILLEGGDLDPKAELLLFLADRAEHAAHTIRPALSSEKVVLCDRHADSTVVYQGYARGLDISKLKDLNLFATGGLVPDLTLLLDVDPEVGLTRQSKQDRLDSEPLEFHRRVREGFLTEAALDPRRWVVVDASQPLERVVEQCWDQLSRRLE